MLFVKIEKILSSALLPSLPQVAVRLLELSKNPDSKLNDVVDAIKMDPAISVKIIKSANSSYFSFRNEVSSIERAVPLLGTNVVSSLVLSFSLVDSLTSTGPLARHFRDYWQQSIAQAAAAETIGKLTGHGIACENFLAGLLMDVGRLAMLKTFGNDYLTVLDQFAESSETFLADLEQSQFELNHALVGAALLEKWQLDDCLVDVARYHHASEAQIHSLKERPYFNLLKITALTAAVCDYFCNANICVARERVIALGASLFGFDTLVIEGLLQQVRQRIDAVADLFSVDVSAIGDPQELLVLANEQLAQVAIRNQVAAFEAMNDRQQMEQANLALESQNSRLRAQAFLDPLTGIYNRRFFDESFLREIIRCRREGNLIGIVMVDIDKFKKLNDTYGHPFGDAVLKRVAAKLQETVRESDILARYGGEEFIVLAHQPTREGLPILADRLLQAIEKLEIQLDGQRVSVTISIGAALSRIDSEDDNETKSRLLTKADTMLYRSKEQGRNQAHLDLVAPARFPAVCLHTPIAAELAAVTILDLT